MTSFRRIWAYFHAQWRQERLTELKKDYTILDGVKEKGHYVGTYLALTTLERYWWGRGRAGRFTWMVMRNIRPSAVQEQRIILAAPGL